MQMSILFNQKCKEVIAEILAHAMTAVLCQYVQ